MEELLHSILHAYGIARPFGITRVQSGLINRTWKVSAEEGEFILQRINTHVFTDPAAVAANIRLIADHLQTHHPGYLLPVPVKTLEGKEMAFLREEGYFRLFSFIPGTHTMDVVTSAEHAWEAARQFGRFTRFLSGMEARKLHSTIPQFHDLSLRFRQFEAAVKEGMEERKKESSGIIAKLAAHSGIVDEFSRLKTAEGFRLRVTHHDTKISNVLFDEQDKGVCVIDLDTVMPGYFISDLGDMMRTYLSPVSEEEKDLSLVGVRKEVYTAIVQGYCAEMGGELTPLESSHLLYSGLFMIYMQALRFLTDHLTGDRYYGARYEGQNFVRATNQLQLLQELLACEQELTTIK